MVMAVSVPAPAVMPAMFRPLRVPAPTPTAWTLRPFWVIAAAAPVLWLATFRPLTVQAAAAPEQAVKVAALALNSFNTLVPPAPLALRIAATLAPLTVEVPLVLVAPWVTVMVSPLPVAAAAGAKELDVIWWMSPVVALELWVKVVTPAMLPALVMPPLLTFSAPEVKVIPVTPLKAPLLMTRLLMVLPAVAPVMAPLRPMVEIPLKAPPVVTFRPPLEARAKVALPLPKDRLVALVVPKVSALVVEPVSKFVEYTWLKAAPTTPRSIVLLAVGWT